MIVDLVYRHCARAIQEQRFDVEELGWLLGLLLGGDRAASLVLCVVEFLDVGLATSWYDDDLEGDRLVSGGATDDDLVVFIFVRIRSELASLLWST